MKRSLLLVGVLVGSAAILFSFACNNGDESTKPRGDTERPTVRITQPGDSATVRAAQIVIKAQASDDQAVKKVVFLHEHDVIGEVEVGVAGGYDVRWVPTIGTHTLRAVAYDRAGNAAEDSVCLFCLDPDAARATVTILEPAQLSEQDAGEIVIRARAVSDLDITAVDFFDGAGRIGEDSEPEGDVYQTTWTAAAGWHFLRAVARDASGALGADTVQVKVGPMWGIDSVSSFCPDSSEAIIEFTLLEACQVTITVSVWDEPVRVRTLLEEAPYPAGAHTITWDGRNQVGLPIPNGEYCCGFSVQVQGHMIIFPCTNITVACP